MKKLFSKALGALLLCSVFTFGGCTLPSYDNFTSPEQGSSTLKPTGDLFVKRNYKGKKPTKEKTIKEYSSGDGRCVIQKKKSYYDVTLDYSKGSYRQIGKAYGEVLDKACPELMTVFEDYLYDMLNMYFYEVKDFSFLAQRAVTLKNTLDKNYQEELDGSAEVLSSGHGFKHDKKLSLEEFYILNMVPDAVRGTSCSAITVNGNKTKSGNRIAARLMEWTMGEDNKLTKIHSVTHFKNGSRSFTSVGLLGMHDVLTVVNDDGVMAGILDVGSSKGDDYVLENKICYTYALRYAAENYSSVKEVSEYMAKNSSRFTYNHNIFVCDEKNAVCVEDVVNPKEGKTVIRDSKTELNDGLKWDDPDCFCVVNSHAAKGNSDLMVKHPDNIVRWKKYNSLFCKTVSKNKIDTDTFKELLTSEKLKDSPVDCIRSDGLVHLLLTDYGTKTMQAVFTPKKGVEEEPVFIDLGKY